MTAQSPCQLSAASHTKLSAKHRSGVDRPLDHSNSRAELCQDHWMKIKIKIVINQTESIITNMYVASQLQQTEESNLCVYFLSFSSQMWLISGINAETSTASALSLFGQSVSASSASWLNKRSYVANVSCCISALWFLATCLWTADCPLKVWPQQHQDVPPSSWQPFFLEATKEANDCECKRVWLS